MEGHWCYLSLSPGCHERKSPPTNHCVACIGFWNKIHSRDPRISQIFARRIYTPPPPPKFTPCSNHDLCGFPKTLGLYWVPNNTSQSLSSHITDRLENANQKGKKNWTDHAWGWPSAYSTAIILHIMAVELLLIKNKTVLLILLFLFGRILR